MQFHLVGRVEHTQLHSGACPGVVQASYLTGAEDKGMTSLSDVVEPRPHRLSSLQEPAMEFSPLAGEPPSRAVSHTPPLAAQGGSRPTFDPLEDFSQDTSNLDATDRCLAAACSLLQFQIAEVRGTGCTLLSRFPVGIKLSYGVFQLVFFFGLVCDEEEVGTGRNERERG